MDIFGTRDVINKYNNIFLHKFVFSKKGYLIHKYDPQGNFIASFAEEVVPSDQSMESEYNLGRIAVDDEDKIVLVLPHPLTISIYYLDGQLLNEYKYNFPYQIHLRQNSKTHFICSQNFYYQITRFNTSNIHINFLPFYLYILIYYKIYIYE